MALSPDGSRLYVANSGSSFVGVMDTQSLAALDPLLVPGNAHPVDVTAGTGNRLFVIGNGIQQIDATTGLTAGPTLGTSPSPVLVYGGTLEISPDRKTLYYGQGGLSPTTLYKIDASSTNLSVLTSAVTGSNGQDVTLNHAGTVIAQPNGAPYSIGLRRTSDLATLGTLQTGSYPVELAFSPDDQVAYAYTDTFGIGAFSTSTYLFIGPTLRGVVGKELFVDPTGRYLFASGDTTTGVYDTGRTVPEPTGSVVALVGAFGLLGRRRRA
jgi:YVTN family beta-propeller protein